MAVDSVRPPSGIQQEAPNPFAASESKFCDQILKMADAQVPSHSPNVGSLALTVYTLTLTLVSTLCIILVMMTSKEYKTSRSLLMLVL